MWIWYVSHSSGGDLTRIARKAHRHGIETVYIKSSDGSTPGASSPAAWSPTCTPAICGSAGGSSSTAPIPAPRRRRGAGAVRKGADCLVIDAESSYEGRYAAADTYMKKLRNRIGRELPDRARHLPLCRLSPRRSRTRSSSAPAARIQPAPALLAHDRDHGRRGLRAHVPFQSRLSPADLPARPDVRQSAAPPDPALPADGDLLRPRRRQLVVMAGDEQSRVAGARTRHRPGRRRRPPTRQRLSRRSRRAVAATSSSGRRST